MTMLCSLEPVKYCIAARTIRQQQPAGRARFRFEVAHAAWSPRGRSRFRQEDERPRDPWPPSSPLTPPAGLSRHTFLGDDDNSLPQTPATPWEVVLGRVRSLRQSRGRWRSTCVARLLRHVRYRPKSSARFFPNPLRSATRPAMQADFRSASVARPSSWKRAETFSDRVRRCEAFEVRPREPATAIQPTVVENRFRRSCEPSGPDLGRCPRTPSGCGQSWPRHRLRIPRDFQESDSHFDRLGLETNSPLNLQEIGKFFEQEAMC